MQTLWTLNEVDPLHGGKQWHNLDCTVNTNQTLSTVYLIEASIYLHSQTFLYELLLHELSISEIYCFTVSKYMKKEMAIF